MKFALSIITPVLDEPITLIEAKNHLRVDEILTEDDMLITSLITVAREWCENFTRRALGAQVLELVLDDFPYKDYIEIPRPPLQSVESIKYKDSDGQEFLFSSADYAVNTDSEPGIIAKGYWNEWPTFVPYPSGAVRIRYTAGYTVENIPKSIKQAMLLLIGHLYEHREAVSTERHIEEVPFAVKSLLMPYRIMGW